MCSSGCQVEALKVQITTSTTEVKTSQSELGDRKRTFQSLEVELQGMLTKVMGVLHKDLEMKQAKSCWISEYIYIMI